MRSLLRKSSNLLSTPLSQKCKNTTFSNDLVEIGKCVQIGNLFDVFQKNPLRYSKLMPICINFQ
jgi:hypothetical protein